MMWARLGPILALGVLAGCASTPATWRVVAPEPVELSATPFFPQAEYQCGPAALATVLSIQVPELEAEALVDEVYVPARQGSLQPELLAAVRRRGLVPVPVDGGLAGLERALQAGSPVLVLQNLGAGPWPLWHYAVVIGLETAPAGVVLRSGTTKREVLRPRRFLATWARSAYWGFTVHAADHVPAWASADDWLATISVWSRTGQIRPAQQAAQAATARWPDLAAAWLARGNAEYAADAPEAAVAAFETALDLQPTAGAYNNLAYVLAHAGCAERAERVLAEGRARYPGFAAFDRTAAAIPTLGAGVCGL